MVVKVLLFFPPLVTNECITWGKFSWLLYLLFCVLFYVLSFPPIEKQGEADADFHLKLRFICYKNSMLKYFEQFSGFAHLSFYWRCWQLKPTEAQDCALLQMPFVSNIHLVQVWSKFFGSDFFFLVKGGLIILFQTLLYMLVWDFCLKNSVTPVRAVTLEPSIVMYISRHISVMRYTNSLKDITLKRWNPLAQSNQYYLIYHLFVKFRL